jgi:hypothetical protein
VKSLTAAIAAIALAIAIAIALSGCGYRSINSGDRPETERFSVVLSSTNLPDAVASDEVLAGVRDELARLNALRGGESYPRCEVEILRSDEASEGIGTLRNGEGVLMPDARATRVGIVARAWIVRSKDAARERDTGDVRALEVIAAAPDARASMFQHTDALRAAGRRVGHRVGSRVLGLPTSSD